MTGILGQQRGFGEAYLFPVIATFGVCLWLLFPSMILVFEHADIMWAFGLCLVALLGSVWLSVQCFADFLNFGIVVIFAIIWTLSGSLLLDSIAPRDIELFDNTAMASICVISIYIYLHAIILSIANFIEKRRDESQSG